MRDRQRDGEVPKVRSRPAPQSASSSRMLTDLYSLTWMLHMELLTSREYLLHHQFLILRI